MTRGRKKGFKVSDETKEKMRQAKLGKKHTEEAKLKMSKVHLGKKHTEETKEKMSKSHQNEKHWAWKGNKAGKVSIHKWVYRYKGKPEICIDCGATCKERKLTWSNKDHTYKRNLNDYISRCYSCHRIYDIKYNHYKLKL